MPGRRLSYTEQQARAAIAGSYSWAESLRKLGLCSTGGGWRVLKKYAELWEISTDHFDPERARSKSARFTKRPIEELLVEKSDASRQNRLQNLRVVCHNCAATLSTHCGRKNRLIRGEVRCRRCERTFVPSSSDQRYCSRACGTRWDWSKLRGKPVASYRRVRRPPYEQLLAEIEATNYCAVGRKYGVSDNAVRKWVKFYEREREAAATGSSGAASSAPRPAA